MIKEKDKNFTEFKRKIPRTVDGFVCCSKSKFKPKIEFEKEIELKIEPINLENKKDKEVKKEKSLIIKH